jgi:hypothetical protein
MDGQRLDPRKADLARWRQDFADRLMERGVAAGATRRQSRGILRPTRKLRDYHRGAEQRQEWPMNPGANAQRTEAKVLDAWNQVAGALRNSESIEDRDLGREAAEYIGSMQTVARARFKSNQRSRALNQVHERRNLPSRAKEVNREIQERSRGR